jgi:hypothetical protein
MRANSAADARSVLNRVIGSFVPLGFGSFGRLTQFILIAYGVHGDLSCKKILYKNQVDIDIIPIFPWRAYATTAFDELGVASNPAYDRRCRR